MKDVGYMQMKNMKVLGVGCSWWLKVNNANTMAAGGGQTVTRSRKRTFKVSGGWGCSDCLSAVGEGIGWQFSVTVAVSSVLFRMVQQQAQCQANAGSAIQCIRSSPSPSLHTVHLTERHLVSLCFCLPWLHIGNLNTALWRSNTQLTEKYCTCML